MIPIDRGIPLGKRRDGVDRFASLMEIQRLAGHAHLTTTLRYMHLAPGAEQREAVMKLDALRRTQV